MAKPLIIANWKSNPPTVAEAVLLVKKIERSLRGLGISKSRNVEVIIAPPFPFLSQVKKILKKSRLGAQNVFWGDVGPYTGEVSWRQLKPLGVTYVIVGHSERKIHLGETDEMINKKVKTLLENDLKPILCVGESKRDDSEIPAIVGEQLKNALAGISRTRVKNLIVAYEPIWAISTMPGARPDTPDNAFRATVYIRKILIQLYGRNLARAIKIIYGGSVNSENIAPFLKEGKMEGALVGGSSLKPEEFVKIVKTASCMK